MTGPQPETRGTNFYDADQALRDLLTLYLPDEERAHLEPHFRRLGGLVGGRLDDLASTPYNKPPTLHTRDRQGRNNWRIEKNAAYRELERVAFSEFEMAAMSHRPALGWSKPIHHVGKYTFQYLFSQSEFGLMCPLSMTDSLTRTLRRFGDEELVDRYLPALLAGEADAFAQGAMFMTEQEAGSDVGATVTTAVPDGDAWRLHGDKWFCSNADADVALVLARPEGGNPGTRGLGLFLMPRRLPDGTPNRYRVLRLKDKLGTRSMASGEIDLNGASAWLVGELDRGFLQIAEMINQSRLSNAVRAAGMMRRALHESLCVARGRQAFGRPLIELPLMQRQLLKIMLPAEEALSMCLFTAVALRRADEGEELGKGLRRILTPLVKFRCCRDARKVAGDAMEVRGGCGYIEEWIEARLVRDSHLGSIWEGTSNIIALDVLRAARREQAHQALHRELSQRLAGASGLPAGTRDRIGEALERSVALVDRAATAGESGERQARQAASALYHATAAVLLATEGAALAPSDGHGPGDARRLLLARLVLDHKLSARDPIAFDETDAEQAVAMGMLSEKPITLEQAVA
ncbi:MAG: acyl-CoA dehydrogenase family protein [Pseudomonadota bacterium]